MPSTISIEAQFNDLDPQKVHDEQKQELFESIRHFMKYMAFQNISEDFAVPEIAQDTRDHLIGLYEHHFEGRK